MVRKPDPDLVDDENPEWTAEDFARAEPAREMLPKSSITGDTLGTESLNPDQFARFHRDRDLSEMTGSEGLD
jgi:hypothetical protein